jgi:hypothetical protein
MRRPKTNLAADIERRIREQQARVAADPLARLRHRMKTQSLKNDDRLLSELAAALMGSRPRPAPMPQRKAVSRRQQAQQMKAAQSTLAKQQRAAQATTDPEQLRRQYEHYKALEAIGLAGDAYEQLQGLVGHRFGGRRDGLAQNTPHPQQKVLELILVIGLTHPAAGKLLVNKATQERDMNGGLRSFQSP